MSRTSKDEYVLPTGEHIFVGGQDTVPAGATLWNGYDYGKQEWIYQGKRDTRSLEELRAAIAGVQ